MPKINIATELEKIAEDLRSANSEYVNLNDLELAGDLDMMDLKTTIRELGDAQTELGALDSRIERAAGKLMRRREEVSKEVKDLQRTVKASIGPMKAEIEGVEELLVKYHVYERKATWSQKSLDALQEMMDARTRSELGDEVADAVSEMLSDVRELLQSSQEVLRTMEVMEKKSHEYRQAGILELLSKAGEILKKAIQKISGIFKVALERTKKNASTATKNLETLLDAYEKAEQA